MVSLVFLVGAVRINAVFMMVFFSIALGFLLIAGAFWEQALRDAVLYDRLLQVSWSFSTSYSPTQLTGCL